VNSRGRALADALIAQAARDAAAVSREIGRNPAVAIVTPSDSASRRFVDIKRQALGNVPIDIFELVLSDDPHTDECLRIIHALNERDDVDAIFLQFPLPPQIDSQAAANAISITKDIDCSSEVAEAAFLRGTSAFTPVAPHAALDLLNDALRSLAGCQIILYGDEDPFTRALQALLQRAGASAYITLSSAQQAADALVVSNAVPPVELIESFERVEVLLDAGYYLPPRPEQWIPRGSESRIGTLLTQYGNVGPLTVAHLALETMTAAKTRTPRAGET
jgi:methylenetetrahydrofolate dehydrogenase (NADP+) / methenyltetrahydrofolate cyclohydrolase